MKAFATSMINQLSVEHARFAIAAVSRNRAYWFGFGGLVVACLFVGIPLFYCGLFGSIASDHEAHVQFIQRGVERGVWPVHFLYPAAVYALSGASRDFVRLAWAALVVLVMSLVAKVWLTYELLTRRCLQQQRATLAHAHGQPQVAFVVFVTGALLLAAPILRPWATNRIYLGQISPNLWHNPTSLVCLPLVILLYFAAVQFLRSGRVRTLFAVGSLAALSVLAKPNYVLAFAPIYALLCLKRFGFSRTCFLSQAAMIPTIALLCWQLVASFDGPRAMRPGLHIAWLPLSAWRVHSSSIALSLLFSLAFPLSYVLIFWRTLRSREMLLLAWVVMLSALTWTLCFAEVRNVDGAVDCDFNFSWGSHLSLFVLFLVTVIDMIDNPAAMSATGSQPLTRGIVALPWWLLGAHAVSGGYWIIRQMIGRGFF